MITIQFKTRVLISWCGLDEKGRWLMGDYSVTTDAEYPFSSRVIEELRDNIRKREGIKDVSILGIVPLRLEDEQIAKKRGKVRCRLVKRT